VRIRGNVKASSWLERLQPRMAYAGEPDRQAKPHFTMSAHKARERSHPRPECPQGRGAQLGCSIEELTGSLDL